MAERRTLEAANQDDRQRPLDPSAGDQLRDLSDGSWLSAITIDHGPAELLGRFFLRADEALQARGITLSFGTFEELVATNAANTDTWHPLIPLFNPNSGPLAPDKAFCLLGRNDEGDVVATQAARLYQWPDTSFFYEAESLRLFYADPARSKQANEKCVVTAPSTKFVSGNVVFSGGGWYRRDYRKLSLSVILPRISRVLAFARWNSDYTISIMAEKVGHQGRHGRALRLYQRRLGLGVDRLPGRRQRALRFRVDGAPAAAQGPGRHASPYRRPRAAGRSPSQ